MTADQAGMNGTLGVSTSTVWFSIPAGEGNALACGNLASGGNASASEFASGGNASASESSVEVSEPHSHQRRSLFCGSRAMGGVEFDGSPISETDEEDRNPDHVPVANGYHEIWDHEDPPLEHEVVNRSEIPPGYRFASSLIREELRARYQFRGNGVNLHSADAEFAYIQYDADPGLLHERACEALANHIQTPPLDLSDDEADAAVPARPEFWPNGNPMWAADPTSPIQLRMPPVPDRNRVFASLADSLEEMPDVPSVAQLRAFWEKQFPGTAPSENNTKYYNQHLFSPSVRQGDYVARPVNVTHYVDDVAPFPLARTRPPFVDSSGEESDSDPGSSESSTQYCADEVLTHDDYRSSSHVTESTAEANLVAEFFKQEGGRPMEIIDVQCGVVAESRSEAKALADVVSAQRVNIEEMTGLNKALAESHQAQIALRELEAGQTHAAME